MISEYRPVRMSWFSTTSWLCGLLWTVFIAGCSTALPLHHEITALPSGPICRVAVLPFLNDSEYPLGDAVVSKVFAAQFQQSGDYMMVQDGEILKVYQQLRLLPGTEPSLEQYQIIADRINAQLLNTGILMEMREDRGEHNTVNPMLVLDIQLRDGRNGETLWTIFHRRQGTDYKKTMHFGTIHTMTGLSRQMAVEIINLLYEKGLVQCNVLPRS
jgi:hypothetical protein